MEGRSPLRKEGSIVTPTPSHHIDEAQGPGIVVAKSRGVIPTPELFSQDSASISFEHLTQTHCHWSGENMEEVWLLVLEP